MKTKTLLIVLSISILFTLPGYVMGDSFPPIDRDTVLANAYVFTTATWVCIPGNANHTYNSVTVGGNYMGIPYNWGGYEPCTTALYKISTGAVAGNYHSAQGIHSDFAGNDCSGYVSQCWQVDHRTTDTLPEICMQFPISYDSAGTMNGLVKGDIMDLIGSHVRLFDCYTTGTNQILLYESTTGVTPGRAVHRVLSQDTTYIAYRFDSIVPLAVTLSRFNAEFFDKY